MKTLSKELDRYLTIRRTLGYGLDTTERNLRRLIAFAESENAEYINTALFLRWRQAFGSANRQTWARRLGMVRLFAQWLQGLDSKHEVPPQVLIPGHYRRTRPYIYSDEEIRRIVETAGALPSINGIRALTISTLFGLIAVTGLRISEARRLHPWPFGVYVVEDGAVWVASTYNRGGYDSRYMGPINISQIRARLRPLWLL
jgi:integrase/recombinase XerD